MKPINLLPAAERPRAASGSQQGSAYVVLGVLGALLLAVLFYTLSVNSVSSKQEQLVAADRDAKAAEAKTAALGSFSDFAQIKTTRVASVRALAESRFDWERMTRELARVLPSGVWITELDASATPDAVAGGSAPAATEAPTGPQLRLAGCAPTQPKVADTIVRLRENLHRAEDVKLVQSTRGDTGTGGGAAPAAPTGTTTAGCGQTGRKANYDFEVTVAFTPAAPSTATKADKKVPVSLGGGS